MMNTFLFHSAMTPMARVDWRSGKTLNRRMNRQVVEKDVAFKLARAEPNLNPLPVNVDIEDVLDDSLALKFNHSGRRPLRMVHQSNNDWPPLRTASARDRTRDLGLVPGTPSCHSLVLLLDEESSITPVTVTDLISEKNIQSIQNQMATVYKSTSHIADESLPAQRLRRADDHLPGVSQFSSQASFSCSSTSSKASLKDKPISAVEQAERNRSANRMRFLCNDPSLSESAVKFVHVNQLVYEEWSTDKRQRALEDGKYVSGKNKVIQGSRPPRPQWRNGVSTTSYLDSAFDEEQISARTLSARSRLQKLHNANSSLDESFERQSIDGRPECIEVKEPEMPSTPLFWHDQVAHKTAKVMTPRPLSSSTLEPVKQETRSLIFCNSRPKDNNVSDVFFERYMSTIRNKGQTPEVKPVDTEVTSQSRLRSNARNTIPILSENRTTSETEQRESSEQMHKISSVRNGPYTETNDSTAMLHDQDNHLRPNSSASDNSDHFDKCSKPDNSKELANDTNSKSTTPRESCEKKSVGFSTHRILSLPLSSFSTPRVAFSQDTPKIDKQGRNSTSNTDGLIIVGNALTSMKGSDKLVEEYSIASGKKTERQSSTDFRHRTGLCGNFRKPVAVAAQHEQKGSNSSTSRSNNGHDESERVEYLSIGGPIGRPRTGRNSARQSKQSASLWKVQIGNTINRPVVKSFNFPGENVKRSVIVKFASASIDDGKDEMLSGTKIESEDAETNKDSIGDTTKNEDENKTDLQLTQSDDVSTAHLFSFSHPSSVWTPPPSRSDSPSPSKGVVICIPTAPTAVDSDQT